MVDYFLRLVGFHFSFFPFTPYRLHGWFLLAFGWVLFLFFPSLIPLRGSGWFVFVLDWIFFIISPSIIPLHLRLRFLPIFHDYAFIFAAVLIIFCLTVFVWATWVIISIATPTSISIYRVLIIIHPLKPTKRCRQKPAKPTMEAALLNQIVRIPSLAQTTPFPLSGSALSHTPRCYDIHKVPFP